jgi:hypothetical protein
LKIYDEHKELKNLLGDEPESVDDKRRREDYHQTFSTPTGQKVLVDMLFDLHFFDGTATDEETALANYARQLLYKIGVLREENLNEIVKRFIEVGRLRIQQESKKT